MCGGLICALLTCACLLVALALGLLAAAGAWAWLVWGAQAPDGCCGAHLYRREPVPMAFEALHEALRRRAPPTTPDAGRPGWHADDGQQPEKPTHADAGHDWRMAVATTALMAAQVAIRRLW